MRERGGLNIIRFAENAEKCNKTIIEEEPRLLNLEGFANNKTLSITNCNENNLLAEKPQQQRKFLENLTNKIASPEDIAPIINSEGVLNYSNNTQRINSSVGDTAITSSTKPLYPTVFQEGAEVKQSPASKIKRRKLFNSDNNIKENILRTSLKSNKKLRIKNDNDSLQQGDTKPIVTKRKRTAIAKEQTKDLNIVAKTQRLKRNNSNKIDDNALSSVKAIPKSSTLQDQKRRRQPTNYRNRTRNMSLYERRYQSEESRGGGVGQQNVISNGYLGSTRNSSSTSSTIHSDSNTDISNQYYIAASSATALQSNTNALTNGGVSNYAPSMATLCNIGNTCYLNSVVYTLRFAPQFVHNLHHLIVDLNSIQQNIGRHRANKSSSLGRNVSGAQIENARSWSSKDLASFENYNMIGGSNINASNSCSAYQIETQKSTQQLLTEKLHDLYQNLHRNEIAESAEPYHADILLHAIQDVSSIFEGNQQQDAHEFLMCVLNSIRDTCQTLIKAISDCPDAVLNSCISCSDKVDSQNISDKSARTQSNQSQKSTAGSVTVASSLSTKTSFFTRKSKRKEEAKNSKSQRLQSPLKECIQGPGGSNSLFYLNTVDLSVPNGKQQQNTNIKDSHSNSSNSAGVTVLNNSTKAPLEQKQLPDDGRESLILTDKERLAEKIRQLGLDFFRDDFEGITVSTTKCLSCETITEQKEIMIDIAVPVPISGLDNADYLDKSTSFIQKSCITREYFRGENKYRCEQCTGYTEAIRSISYEILPRLLVIQLSRFSGGMEKINSYIPTSFTLKCFCAKCCELSDGNKLHIYKLYSVITHVGATMSVGHYIAYTCSLDWANEYVNCPKDIRRNQQMANVSNNSSTAVAAGGNASVASSSSSSNQSSTASAAASALASSGTSLIKKMKFGRNKASSSGDMSKNVKNLNGVTSRMITNGIGQLSMNAICQSVQCCATRFGANDAMNTANQLSTGSTSSSTNIMTSSNSGVYSASNSDVIDENQQNGTNYHSSNNYSTSGYGSTGRGSGHKTAAMHSSSSLSSSTTAEPIWYMCDDDKIKAMTQREFEELLSPTRKITITPYLLFYARVDLQPTGSQPTPPKQAPVQTWLSNESNAAQRLHADKI